MNLESHEKSNIVLKISIFGWKDYTLIYFLVVWILSNSLYDMLHKQIGLKCETLYGCGFWELGCVLY